MVSLFILVLQLLLILRLTVGASFSLPNCVDHCGGVQIPYPFGIGANCYHDPSYEIICNTSFSHSKPFLGKFNLEVLNINWLGRYSRRDPRFLDSEKFDQMLTVAMPTPNVCGKNGIHSPDLKGSPFLFSRSNILVMEGCGGSAVLKKRNGNVLVGCASVCTSDKSDINGTSCYGVGCCQASLDPSYQTDYYLPRDEDLDFYEIDVNFEQQMKFNSCNASVALIDGDSMRNFSGSLSSLKTFPTALQWKATFVTAIPFSKVVNVSCGEFRCNCPFAYEGNSYLPYGCQVVEECHECKAARCNFHYNSTNSVPTIAESAHC